MQLNYPIKQFHSLDTVAKHRQARSLRAGRLISCETFSRRFILQFCSPISKTSFRIFDIRTSLKPEVFQAGNLKHEANMERKPHDGYEDRTLSSMENIFTRTTCVVGCSITRAFIEEGHHYTLNDS